MKERQIGLNDALDIFEENLPEIRDALKANMLDELAKEHPPKPNKSATLFWVQASVHAIRKENITKKYNPTIRAITARLQPKTKDTIGQEEIERAKQVPIAQFLSEPPVRGMAKCPFHNERTPSFQVRKDNTFICYGCGEHGDAIDFYQKTNRVGFIDAVRQMQNV